MIEPTPTRVPARAVLNLKQELEQARQALDNAYRAAAVAYLAGFEEGQRVRARRRAALHPVTD